MATRINTKFVLVLVATVLAAGGILAGLWVLQIRGDTARHIKSGDELMAEGRALLEQGDAAEANAAFERALREYGRAVNKEPAELSHVRKVRSALREIRPATQDQANEYDQMRLGILRHVVRYRPQDAEAHLTLLEALYRFARWFDQIDTWQQVVEAADEMWERVPPGDPQRDRARLYRGIARMRMMGFGSMGQIVGASGATEEEVDDALADLEAYFEAHPADDLGRAALLEAKMSVARQLQLAGVARRAEEALAELDRVQDEVLATGPIGPELARVIALRRTLDRGDDPTEAERAALEAAVDRMVELVTPSNDPMLMAEAGLILRSADREAGLDRAIDLMQRYVADNDEAYHQQLMLADFYFRGREFDKARATAAEVINAPPVSVSALSRVQPMLRMRAAALNFNVAYQEWERADVAEKPAKLAEVEKAREVLAGLVVDEDTEPLLLQADGKLAMARRDFATAADRFERAIKLTPGEDFETLWHDARALEQLGQLGLALQRLRTAQALQPNNAVVISERARLEYRIGRYDDAQRSIDQVRRLRERSPGAVAEATWQLVQRLITAMDANTTLSGEADNAMARALMDSDAAVKAGQLDDARAILETALADAEDRLPVLSELVQVELRSGDRDKARSYLEEALEIHPTNTFLLKLKASLENEDQIEGLKHYIANLYPDEKDRAVHTLIHLRMLAREMEAAADRREAAGQVEQAAEMRQRAAVARQEAESHLARAEQIAPDHPALIDHLFNRGLQNRDWAGLEDLVARARRVEADQAGGLLFKGRLELARENYREAVQTLTEATARKPYDSLTWRLLGRAYERVGNFAEALRAYEHSYETNPNDQYAVRWYVNLLMQTGERTRALLVLRQARHTVPNDQLLQEVRLELEAELGDLNAALDERRSIYEKTPRNRLNALRLAALLSTSRPSRVHAVNDEGVPIYDSDQWRVLAEQQRKERLDEVAAAWLEESREILAAIEDAEGLDLELAAVKAELLKRQGLVKEGEEILRDYAQAHPEEVAALVALGRYQADMRRLDDAIATLERARAAQPAGSHDADVALAEIYFNHGLWDRAMVLYEAVANDTEDRGVRLRLAECYTKLSRWADAEALLETVVEETGHDYFTLMLSVTVLEGQAARLRAEDKHGKAEQLESEIDDLLTRAEQVNPSSPLPRVRRAQRLVTQYDRSAAEGRPRITLLDDALRLLEGADQVQAGAEPTSRLRVEILRKKGDVRGAIGELTRLLDRDPENVPARRLLIQMYAESNNLASALQVAEDAIRANPSVALWHEAKGDLLFLRQDRERAADEFREAYRLQPNSQRLAKFVEIELSVEEPDYEAIVERIRDAEFALVDSPNLRAMYGRALHGVDDLPAALEQMRQAYTELKANLTSDEDLVIWFRSLQVIMSGEDVTDFERFLRSVAGDDLGGIELLWLARTWYLTGEGLTRAIELLNDAWEAADPGNEYLRLQIALDQGQFLVQVGEYGEAVKRFERALEIEPRHPTALNNAAYLWAEHLDDPERGLGFAERAAEIRPDDPFVLDTLGWAYYRLGRYEEAEEPVRRSIRMGESAENCYHLAMIMAATDRDDNALTYLRKASELRPSDQIQRKIDRLTEEIGDRIRQ